jgi:hypothetical protein
MKFTPTVLRAPLILNPSPLRGEKEASFEDEDENEDEKSGWQTPCLTPLAAKNPLVANVAAQKQFIKTFSWVH